MAILRSTSKDESEIGRGETEVEPESNLNAANSLSPSSSTLIKGRPKSGRVWKNLIQKKPNCVKKYRDPNKRQTTS